MPTSSDLVKHKERLDNWLVELWGAHAIDLHMCDGTVKKGQRRLLQNIRMDVMALRRELRRLERPQFPGGVPDADKQ